MRDEAVKALGGLRLSRGFRYAHIDIAIDLIDQRCFSDPLVG